MNTWDIGINLMIIHSIPASVEWVGERAMYGKGYLKQYPHDIGERVPQPNPRVMGNDGNSPLNVVVLQVSHPLPVGCS